MIKSGGHLRLCCCLRWPRSLIFTEANGAAAVEALAPVCWTRRTRTLAGRRSVTRPAGRSVQLSRWSVGRFRRRAVRGLVVIALRIQQPGFLLTRRHPAVPALVRLARAEVDPVVRVGGGCGVALEVVP
jgi:hypothetical protein